MNEVSVLIRKASRTACGRTTDCGLDDINTNRFCVECGLPACYPQLEPYSEFYELAVQDDPQSIRIERSHRSLMTAAIAIFVLNMMDVVITLLALANGATEMNPLAAWLIDTKLIFPAKISACSLALFFAYSSKKDPTSILRRMNAAWAVTGAYALVVILNSIHYLIGRFT